MEERPSSLPADYFFSAKEFDPETGFYNFGARYLDPRFSKWMTTDPALGDYLAGKAGGFSLVERLSERLGSRKARKAIEFLERLRKEPDDAIERGE